MKRTTIFIDEQLERELAGLARRRGQPVAALVREAVERYVVDARDAGRRPLAFVAAGRSGRHDVAERHEDLLFQDPPTDPVAPPAATRRSRGTRTPRRTPRKR